MPQYQSPRGFTLVELMVVVAIIGILSAIGYPSYTRYIVKANRSAAESFMQGVGSLEERYLLDARTYFCTAAGACTNVLSASTTPAFIVPASVSQNYTMSVAAPDTTTSAPTYTITATPIGSQLARDTECQNLTLDQNGAKGINGGTSTNVSSCW